MGVLATCKVSMANGQNCRADEIEAGDVLQDGSIIQYILESDTAVETLKTIFKEEEPLLITAWHPIFMNGEYQFPTEVISTTASTTASIGSVTDETKIAKVFSFLTDTGRDVVISGIPCAALAHGSDMYPLKHYFFGTGRVQRAMLKLQPDEKGKVVCSRFVRHAVDGFVTDMY